MFRNVYCIRTKVFLSGDALVTLLQELFWSFNYGIISLMRLIVPQGNALVLLSQVTLMRAINLRQERSLGRANLFTEEISPAKYHQPNIAKQK